MRLRLLLACAGLGLVAAATPAGATPIGPPPLSCTNGTCQGSIYELTYSGSPISFTPTTQTFAITLTINPTTYSGGGVFINAVAPKVSSAENSVSLVSAPGVLGNWTTMNGGINSGGCSMAGSGFVRAADQTPPIDAPVPVSGTYTWVFDVTIPTGAPCLPPRTRQPSRWNTRTVPGASGGAGLRADHARGDPRAVDPTPVAGGLAFLARRRPTA